MGYSCTRNAMNRLNFMFSEHDNSLPSNTWKKKDGTEYFYEIGKENANGAITGAVWLAKKSGYAYRAGSFKIDSEGKVLRFPHMNTTMKKLSTIPLPAYSY
jgi:hypothetical protein